MSSLKKQNKQRAGETAPWSRVLEALAEDPSLLSSTRIRWLTTTPVIPAPRDPTPSPGLCGHTCVSVHTHTLKFFTSQEIKAVHTLQLFLEIR